MTTPNEITAAPPIALIIPTVHRRVAFFARALQYLGSCRYRGPIIVSDHSPPEYYGIISDVVKGHTDLEIKLLHHAPDLHFLRRLALCASEADTSYVHLHADDDFILLPTLALLVREMERHPDCAAATGIHMNIWVRELTSETLRKFAYQQTDPFERLIAQLERYSSVLYALRRRDEVISTFSFAADHCPDVQFWQYLESCVAVISGSVAVVDELHYVREVHKDKWSMTLTKNRSSDHFPYLVLSPEFQPRVSAFRAALINACEARNVSIDTVALDDGLIHLLYRGFGIMGLPEKRVLENPSSQEAVLQAKMADPNSPTLAAVRSILKLARGD